MSYDEELLAFYEYLQKELENILTMLQPYFKELEAREEARENEYGVGNPGDRILLARLSSIQNLLSKARTFNTFAELKDSLVENGDTAQYQEVEKWIGKIKLESNLTAEAKLSN